MMRHPGPHSVRLVLAAIAAVGGCTPGGPGPARPQDPGPGVARVADPAALPRDAGATIYVPVYSHIQTGDRAEPINLAVTLSVRNADPAAPVALTRVAYHDSAGKRLRDHLEAGPVRVAPLASAAFFVPERDTAGGVGACFLVEWTGPAGAVDPVVEAVHVNTVSSQGLVFVTQGRVIASRRGAPGAAASVPAQP